jgi:hypothetical protein
MRTYKILYKFYKGNNTFYPEKRAVKTITAYNKEEAIRLFGMWPKLIIRMWEV